MKERPIIFSAPMVRAILAGTKTQTRRIVKPQPELQESYSHLYPPDGPRTSYGYSGWYPSALAKNARHYGSEEHFRKGMAVDFAPHGKPGDRLWVRETWAAHVAWNKASPYNLGLDRRDGDNLWWAADGDQVAGSCGIHPDRRGKWRPSTHMPRWASRITLEITDVRVQRLREISEGDVESEGCSIVKTNCDGECGGTPCRIAFRPFIELWESIHGEGAWDANPWVWVYSFKRVCSCH